MSAQVREPTWEEICREVTALDVLLREHGSSVAEFMETLSSGEFRMQIQAIQDLYTLGFYALATQQGMEYLSSRPGSTRRIA